MFATSDSSARLTSYGLSCTVEAMRILHLTDSLVVGGSQQVLIDLANALVGRGHDVGVAAGDGELWRELLPEVRRFHHPGARLGHRQALWVRRLLAEHSWDVVHTHQRGVSTAVWMTRRWLKTSHVEHVHNVFPVTSTKAISFRGDRLIACGSEVARMLLDDYGRPPELVRTVANGVHDHGIRRLPNSGSHGPLRIVNIARVEHQKDPIRFIEVIRALDEQGVRVSATWVGDGVLLEYCRQQVDEAGFSERIAFPGSRRPAVGLLADADVLLLTSRHEGLPLSVLEAGAAGCAVVAPGVGSLADVIQQGRNGWLYRPGAQPAEIAGLLATVAASPDSWNEVGRHGREVYEQDFTISRVTDQVEEVYGELRTGRGAG